MVGKRREFSSNEILKGILEKDRLVIEYVYKRYFETVRKFVESHYGSSDDAWDVFQEGMINVYDIAKKGNIEIKFSFQTFFVSICKNLWFLQIRNKNQLKKVTVDDLDLLGQDENELLANFRRNHIYRLFYKHYLTLSVDCQKMLKLAMSNKDGKLMAEELNLASSQSAYNKKRICVEKLIQLITTDSEYNISNDYEKL